MLPVPQELAAADLELINATMRLSEIVSDFARVNDDPLAAMLALNQYPQTVVNLQNAFVNISAVYKTAGISLPDGVPGASFVNFISDMEAKQQTSSATTP